MIAFSFIASERAHWVASQASWLPPWSPWKEEEEGEPWGSWAVLQSQEADWSKGQIVPQTETCREDPNEEDVSTFSESKKRFVFMKHIHEKWSHYSHLYLYSIKMHEQRKTKQKDDDKTPQGAVPAYLLDREGQSRAKVLSNMIKQKRKEKAVSIS